MTANKTNRNHFVPCFYTKQWTGEDGRLCQFSRPYLAVVPKRVHSEATGYSEHLYTENNLPSEDRTCFEDVFLMEVDQQASDAIQKLLNGHPDRLSGSQRVAWVRFIMSMLHRSPGAIESLRRRWDEPCLTVGLEARYQRERNIGDPPTVNEYLRQVPPDADARGKTNFLQAAMDSPSVGQRILNMRWGVFRISANKYPFLTSDRPVVIPNGLLRKESYIGIPIAPAIMFLGANDEGVLRHIERLNVNDFVKTTNVIVTRQAERFVYGVNDRALRFVERHFLRRH